MKALTLRAEGLRLSVDEPPPEPTAGEALVRVLKAGICSTDLELVKGYAGFTGTLGHEFVGEVMSATAEPSWVGRRVVGSINLGCGGCAVCAASGAEHCPHRTVLGIHRRDGAFADYLTLPLANLLPVPDEVDNQTAVFTEPLAAALRIREQIVLSPAARMAVLGPGRLGLLIAQVLALAGGHPMVFGRRAASLELPAALGLDTELVERGEDDAFDVVVEATGNAEGLKHALRLVRPLGMLALKSTFAGAPAVDLTKLVVGEVTVVGSRCGPFAPALRLLAKGQIEVQAMIEADYPLVQGLAALEHAARPGVRKILLTP